MDSASASNRAFVEFGRHLREEIKSRSPLSSSHSGSLGITCVIISAHDIRERVTVATASRVSMFHDHPAAAGRSWSAPGNEKVASSLIDTLQRAGITAERGEPLLDHGAWVPLSLIFPDENVSVVTLSLAAHMDPLEHWRLGEALASVPRDAVLIIGSGGATHSQTAFRAGYFGHRPIAEPLPFSSKFNDWLVRSIVENPTGTPHAASEIAPPSFSERPDSSTKGALERQRRTALLVEAPKQETWAQCHPTLDHWLPLLITTAAAKGDRASVAVSGYQHSLSVLSLRFDGGGDGPGDSAVAPP